jgi:hypothetical protein
MYQQNHLLQNNKKTDRTHLQIILYISHIINIMLSNKLHISPVRDVIRIKTLLVWI